MKPDINRMSSQSAADEHGFSFPVKATGAPGKEKLKLGSHHSPQKRKPDGSAMEMAAKSQICSPSAALLKKQRRVKEKNLIPAGIARSHMAFQFSFFHLRHSKTMAVIGFLHIAAYNPDILPKFCLLYTSRCV